MLCYIILYYCLSHFTVIKHNTQHPQINKRMEAYFCFWFQPMSADSNAKREGQRRMAESMVIRTHRVKGQPGQGHSLPGQALNSPSSSEATPPHSKSAMSTAVNCSKSQEPFDGILVLTHRNHTCYHIYIHNIH